MKYQIGEVVRVRETGALVTVIGLDDDGLPIGYLTVADEKTAWYKESSLEPVNGGMPKPEEESAFNSINLCAMSMDELLHLQDEVASAIEAHDRAIRKRRIQLLHEAINALDACMVDAVLADAAFFFSDADLHAYSIADMSGVLAAELDAIDK